MTSLRQWCQVPQFAAYGKARKAFLEAAAQHLRYAPFARIQYARWMNALRNEERLRASERQAGKPMGNSNASTSGSEVDTARDTTEPVSHDSERKNQVSHSKDAAVATTGRVPPPLRGDGDNPLFNPFSANYVSNLGDIRVSPSAGALTVMTYNILCGNHILTPPPVEYAHHSVWSNRVSLILSHIEQHNPDVLCLQEVDVPGFWAQRLDALGYSFVYHARTDATQRASVDGCAIAYKRAKLRLVTHTVVRYIHHPSFTPRTHIGLAGLFEVLPSSTLARSSSGTNRNFVCITTSHFIWNARRGEVKLAQLQTCMNGLAAWFRLLNKAVAEPSEAKSESTPTIESSEVRAMMRSPSLADTETGDDYYFKHFLARYTHPHPFDLASSSTQLDDPVFPPACPPQDIRKITGPTQATRGSGLSDNESALPPLYANSADYVPVLSSTKPGELYPPMSVVTLTAKPGDNVANMERDQIEYIRQLRAALDAQGGLPSNVLERTAFIICGDFNATPASRVSEFMRTGMLELESTYGDTKETVQQIIEKDPLKPLSKRLYELRKKPHRDITDEDNKTSAGGFNMFKEKAALPVVAKFLNESQNITQKFNVRLSFEAPSSTTQFDGTETTFQGWAPLSERVRYEGLPWITNLEDELRKRLNDPESDTKDGAKPEDDIVGYDPDYIFNRCNNNADAYGYPGREIETMADGGSSTQTSKYGPSPLVKRVRVSAPPLSIMLEMLRRHNFVGSPELIAYLSADVTANKRVKLLKAAGASSEAHSEQQCAEHNTTPSAACGGAEEHGKESKSSVSTTTLEGEVQRRLVTHLMKLLWMNETPLAYSSIKDHVVICTNKADAYAAILLCAKHVNFRQHKGESVAPFSERVQQTLGQVIETQVGTKMFDNLYQDIISVKLQAITNLVSTRVHVKTAVFHPFLGLASAYQTPGLPVSYRVTGFQTPGRYQVDYIYYSPISVARMLGLSRLREETLRALAETELMRTAALFFGSYDKAVDDAESKNGDAESEASALQWPGSVPPLNVELDQFNSPGTGLRLDAVLDLPSDVVTFPRNFVIPSRYHGSDHLSIMAAFSIVQEDG